MINFAPDVQDLMIEMVVNLLETYQSITPAKPMRKTRLWRIIELQNEDDIFFYTSSELDKTPDLSQSAPSSRFFSMAARKISGRTPHSKPRGAMPCASNENFRCKKYRYSDQSVDVWQPTICHKSFRQGEKQRLLDNAEFFHDLAESVFMGVSPQRFVPTGYRRPARSVRRGKHRRCCLICIICAPIPSSAPSTATTISAKN